MVETCHEFMQEIVTEAMPQVLSGEVDDAVDEQVEVWPEQWGITLGQFRLLIAECRKDSLWSEETTMREFVSDYVTPLTMGKGVGYALVVNAKEPLSVNVLVSHCWLESAEWLLQALGNSVSETDVLFIAGLAMYQCEDGAGPYLGQQMGNDPDKSPFTRVLRYIQRQGKGSLESCWSMHRLVALIPALLFLLALLLVEVPVYVLGCVPSGGKCFIATIRMSSALPLLCTWRPVELEPWAGAAASCGNTLLLFAFLAWALHWYMPPYVGRVVVVPNDSFDISALGDPTGLGGSCGSAAADDELGVDVVKLEVWAACNSGVPVQLASPWSPPGQTRCPISGACATKQDTRRSEEGEAWSLDEPVNDGIALKPQRHSRKGSPMKGVVARVPSNPLVDMACVARRAPLGDGGEGDEENAQIGCIDQYREVNDAVKRVVDEAWHEAVRRDALWALAIAAASACGARLVAGRDEVAASACMTLGLLLGHGLGFRAAASAARRPATAPPPRGSRRSAGRGWSCTAAALAAGAAFAAVLFWAAGSIGPLRYIFAGAAASFAIDAVVVAVLFPCLAASAPKRVALVLMLGATACGLAALSASPGDGYPAVFTAGSLAFGLVLGPFVGSWASAARWGVGLPRPLKKHAVE